ncbi:MAG: hypothetical protein NC112_09260 [Oxalobacter formigenes]|nr:hypothetical protein [Oxalobacter formigenes]
MNAVDICNLALSRLGDVANIASIDPPEKSWQAEQCARFWPVALHSLLEMYPWTFATKCERLARLSADTGAWGYAYARPSDCIRILAVFTEDGMASAGYGRHVLNGRIGVDPAVQCEYYETRRIGEMVAILTNVENAAARYITDDVDNGKFSPMFADTLSWLLASHLAGCIIKGDTGVKMAANCQQMFRLSFSQAAASDASQHRIDMDFIPEVMNIR